METCGGSTMNDFYFKQEPSRFNIEQINELMMDCYKKGASDITFQTNEQVFSEVHGRMIKVTQRKLTNNEVSDIINAMYGANGTTQILGGKDVDTHYEIRPTRSDRYRFRINATGCMIEGFDAIQITARAIPNEPPEISSMDLPEKLLEGLCPYQGVVYVTGATGSGKSTLLAAIIRHIIEPAEANRKALTYEAPIEFVYDTIAKPSSIISQSEIPRHLPSFAAGVRNALRRKPNLILVGEARDQETFEAVLEAAMTGHPVYTTLHSNGVAETVRRLVHTFPSEERESRLVDIFETIRVVIWQKLVPSLDGKRVALREFLVFEEDIRDQLLSVPADQATKVARQLLKKQGQTMEVDANQKFEAGLISERDHRLLVHASRKADAEAGL